MAKARSKSRTLPRVIAGLGFAAAVTLGWVRGSMAGPTADPRPATVPGPTRAASAPAVPPAATPGAGVSHARPAPMAAELRVPRVSGRLQAAQLGLVINSSDPYSVEVGAYYAGRRGLRPAQVLHVELPLRDALTAQEFEALRERIEQHFGADIQALALAWNAPFAVECNSITGALALGVDSALCANSCERSRASGYFNSASLQPWRDHGLRPSMLIAAGTVDAARRLIDRGVAADGSAGLRGAPPVVALYVPTQDVARNVRALLYPRAGLLAALGVEVRVRAPQEMPQQPRLIVLQTGLAQVPHLDALQWVPGALADHLTSFGGALRQRQGQTTALQWIESGATASYGNVSEPCNHLQKFPHPQALLLNYVQGSSAIEAYWKSVAWPQQGVFVGEPLAAPFARPR